MGQAIHVFINFRFFKRVLFGKKHLFGVDGVGVGGLAKLEAFLFGMVGKVVVS